MARDTSRRLKSENLRMPPLRTLGCVFLTLFAGFHACVAEGRRISIGLTAPLTGPASQHGNAVTAGLSLGLTQGKCQDRVTIQVEDDGYDPKRSVSAAKKLLSSTSVDAFIAVGSGPSLAIAPLTDAKGIPLLSLAGDSSVSTKHSGVVRLRLPAAQEGKLIAEMVRKSFTQPVALICTTNDFTLAVCDGVAKELGPQVGYRDDIPPEETEFRTVLAKVRSKQSSVILPILMPGRLGAFTRQARELGIKTPFRGGAFFESTNDVETSAGALIGAEYIFGDVHADFRQVYAGLSSVAPGSIAWAAIFYDVGRILCDALDKNESIMEHFQKLDGFPGVVGAISYRSEAGDKYLYYPFIPKRITERGFEAIR